MPIALHDRPRLLLVVGLAYTGVMLIMDIIARSGIAEGIPILGWGTVGEFTRRWWTVILIKRSIGAVIFVFIMSFFLKASPKSPEPET